MRIGTIATLGTCFALVGCATTGERGYARLNCLAEADGSVSDCRVVSEQPEGYGFGEAAIEAMSQGKLKARTAPARFETTIQFRLAPGGAPAPQ